ncbi:ATP-dependent RecD-like DNA helicase [Estrella lausannensis]|uniref:ATP-dependent RecD2 DNA helicase n=1 Tax=Estrella lausannensis TaxID=483423 RepID=A0A0H5DRV7_9BACT|nr:ATP-dependent RecD-like DNA helicase [Estrella lausannensis]CRX39451.1 Exodeoxyribonuclease V, alpha subunit [Estrella lausannensis]
MEELVGTIERITYQSPETGYTVLQLLVKKATKPLTVVGTMLSVQCGETIRVKGFYKSHLVHGRQFEAKEHAVEMPQDITGITKYLGSGLIKGIGPVFATRIVDAFGEETLSIIDNTPERLLEVQGVGEKRLKAINACWSEQKSIRELMIFLQTYSISPSFAFRIFRTFGAESIQKVKENPYLLAREIVGIGFKSADSIATKIGISKQSPLRIESGIHHVLFEAAEGGHSCLPVSHFLPVAEAMLEVDRSIIDQTMQALAKEKKLMIQDLPVEGNPEPYVWTPSYFLSEAGISKELRRLLSALSNLRSVDKEKALEWVQKKLSIELAAKQKEAVSAVLSDKVHIITGGPGTGKSTITKAILAILSHLTEKIVLAAPTGRAAKRLSEITGRGAKTIHSLLEFDFSQGGFKRNRKNPLDAELIIVDESSMIDTLLMYQLLKAIPDEARLVLVGDINQLPSVGAGNVLKDLIASRAISVTHLNEIFRQAQGSRIVTNAHKINEGIYPDIQNRSGSDFYFIEAKEPEDVLKEIITLVVDRLPQKFGFKAREEIQVLSPMKKGVVGTYSLNEVLQGELNKSDKSLIRQGATFKEGDKVMQMRNNYKKEVYNGDIGYIQSIDAIEKEVIVAFDDKPITYDFMELDELMLAYAVSVHKYQGSECPCIVMPIHTTHFKLLTRNLLYTGVTRGKKLVVLVGSKKALAIAVHNDEVKMRHTGLKQAMTALHFHKL